MSKTHWLIFVSLTALSSGLVWHLAPTLGAKLPPAARARICDTVADVQNRLGTARDGFAERMGKSVPKPARSTEYEVSADAVAPVAVPAQTSPTVTQALPNATPNPASALREESPYDKGIVRIGPSASSGATWGVLSRVAPIEDLDGKTIGNVAGGRFFLIERRAKAGGALMLIGNFTPKKLQQTVRVAAKDVICFTRSLDDLSDNQKSCLRKYYQLNGEAEALKSRLQVRESKKNPYAVEAAKALSELRAKEAEASRRADDADSNRNATYEIAPLAEKVRELSKKARAWKESHASELSDPVKDPGYLMLIKERDMYGEAIRGLAF